jgi:GTPase involved in cell partitioning and DNA repair
MYINLKEINMQEYKDLQKEILEYETNWEDKELRPHTNKSDRKVKQREENADIQKTEKPKEKQKVLVSKNVKKVQDDAQNTLLNVLKDPITIETFPLHVVKSVKVVSENPSYRVVKAYNCPVELRLSKLSVGNNAVFKPGDKIDVF